MEFGHKVLLCETAEKFITDYEVYEKQQADCELTESVIERHEKLFGSAAQGLGGGQGFLPGGGEVPRVGRAGGDVGDPAADAGFPGQGAGTLASVSGGDRGDDFGLKTRVSAGSLFLSRL